MSPRPCTADGSPAQRPGDDHGSRTAFPPNGLPAPRSSDVPCGGGGTPPEDCAAPVMSGFLPVEGSVSTAAPGDAQSCFPPLRPGPLDPKGGRPIRPMRQARRVPKPQTTVGGAGPTALTSRSREHGSARLVDERMSMRSIAYSPALDGLRLDCRHSDLRCSHRPRADVDGERKPLSDDRDAARVHGHALRGRAGRRRAAQPEVAVGGWRLAAP